MATVREIITRALRRLRVLASGEVPTDAEANDALTVTQGIFDKFASGGMFGRVGDLLPGADAGSQVIAWDEVDGIELPARIQTCGGVQMPRDLALAELADETTNEPRRYLYDARRAAWQRIDSLTLDDFCPLSSRSAEGVAAVVAMAIADEFGAQPSELIIRDAGAFRFDLSVKPGEPRRTVTAEYF